MPVPPSNLQRREVLSEDYHDDKITIDFYTNSAIAIYRGDEVSFKNRVWFDNLEKQELLSILKEELGDFDE